MSCINWLLPGIWFSFLLSHQANKANFFETVMLCIMLSSFFELSIQTGLKKCSSFTVEILYECLQTNGPCAFFINFQQSVDGAITAWNTSEYGSEKTLFLANFTQWMLRFNTSILWINSKKYNKICSKSLPKWLNISFSLQN